MTMVFPGEITNIREGFDEDVRFFDEFVHGLLMRPRYKNESAEILIFDDVLQVILHVLRIDGDIFLWKILGLE